LKSENNKIETTNGKEKYSKKKVLALILLVIVTILWGTTFIITKIITATVPIFIYLGFRFFIAFLGFSPFFPRLKKINKQIIIGGIISGTFYFLGMVFQTFGLQTTTAGKGGFITGLNTIMVPFFAYIIFHKHFKKKIWAAVILSVIGLGFFFLEGLGGQIGVLMGDLLVLICAVFCALFIVYNDKYVNLMDVYPYSIIQLLTISGFSFLCSLLFRENYSFSFMMNPYFWFIMVYMGIGVTTLTFLFQNWSQQYQDPATTAVIFTLEPVFAVLFGFLIGQEFLSISGWIGSILIFIAILIAVVKKKKVKAT
jgi:drug/metabolite transporter (DMT)-like permease